VIKVVDVLGLDIGGANTKASFLKTRNGIVKELRTAMEYLPVWKTERGKLSIVLEKLKKRLVGPTSLDGIGLTMTAELSDAYLTKREGVNHILDCTTDVFNDVPVFVLSVKAKLLPVGDARKNPLDVASANWAATGWLVSQTVENCLIIDVGSTTTSIIPVIEGKNVAEGRSDLEKLGNGELIYSGSLRTNVATIIDDIFFQEGKVRLSSEFFAQSGDIHLLLGNIREEEYTVETCDGRGKTKREAMARLARVVCADIEMLTEQQIMAMAQYVYARQLEQIAEGLKQVYERIKVQLGQEKISIIVTGLGRNFLARKAAEKMGFSAIIDLGERLGTDIAVVLPSVSVALIEASNLEGKPVKWKLL
jgi:probable H4MPT-linked C1 transfer pathway protein